MCVSEKDIFLVSMLEVCVCVCVSLREVVVCGEICMRVYIYICVSVLEVCVWNERERGNTGRRKRNPVLTALKQN